MKPKHTAPTELPQARQRILQSILLSAAQQEMLSPTRCERVYSRDCSHGKGVVAVTTKLNERIETLKERLEQLKAKQASLGGAPADAGLSCFDDCGY